MRNEIPGFQGRRAKSKSHKLQFLTCILQRLRVAHSHMVTYLGFQRSLLIISMAEELKVENWEKKEKTKQTRIHITITYRLCGYGITLLALMGRLFSQNLEMEERNGLSLTRM